MGLRKYKRQIANARMSAAGVGNVNKKLKYKGEDGLVNWRKVLKKESEKAQMDLGVKIVRQRQLSRRKIRPINRTA